MGRSSTILLIFVGCLLLGLSSCGPPIKQGLKAQAGGDRSYQAMDFRGWDLQHTSFKNADVHDVDFRFALLQGADFSHSDLENADLRGTSLDGANFTGSNINEALFFEADMRGAIFDLVNWDGHKFRDAKLAKTSFRSAQLSYTDFTGADLTKSDFSDTDLRYTTFDYAQLIEVKFNKANLSGLDLHNHDLRGVDLSGANLTNTNLSQANLKGAKLSGATLVGTNFEGANLLGIDFSGVYLDQIKLKGAKLKAPRFAGAQIKRVSFDGLDLSHSSFKEAWLRGVSFHEVNLTGSDFSLARLEDTLMLKSNLTLANISGADFSAALLYQTNFTKVQFEQTLFPTIFEPKTKTTFVQAPMGCYTMGNNFEDSVGFDASPHEVCLNDFFVATKEVTQLQFASLLGYNPSYHGKRSEQRPIENINAHEIRRFLAEFEALTTFKVRLPTEAEWEYVCRELGAKVRYGNGKNTASPLEIVYDGTKPSALNRDPTYQSKLVWGETLDVGSSKPNKLGVFDMSGNVAEVVSDQWDSKAYQRPKKTVGMRATQGIRGGHFDSSASDIRCAKRSFMTTEEMDRHVGFRMVKVIDPNEVLNNQRFQLK